jgi:hypothetical protein
VVSAVLLNLYVTLAVMSGSIGANGVRDFATTKAVVQAKAQLQVTCPAPHPRPHGLPPGPVPSLHGHKSW